MPGKATTTTLDGDYAASLTGVELTRYSCTRLVCYRAGEGCLDKPLATLWKNYCQSSRADVSMRLSVCGSGLQVRSTGQCQCDFLSADGQRPGCPPGSRAAIGVTPSLALPIRRRVLTASCFYLFCFPPCSQATTAEHGLTEYWAHRVTWCSAPAAYPRIFAWVYRHEGRRLKVARLLKCLSTLTDPTNAPFVPGRSKSCAATRCCARRAGRRAS